jgi:hypothetical protein
MAQALATPVDEKPQTHSDASMVMVQGIDTMIEVDDLNAHIQTMSHLNAMQCRWVGRMRYGTSME